jgi:hypothetical protein
MYVYLLVQTVKNKKSLLFNISLFTVILASTLSSDTLQPPPPSLHSSNLRGHHKTPYPTKTLATQNSEPFRACVWSVKCDLSGDGAEHTLDKLQEDNVRTALFWGIGHFLRTLRDNL